MGHDFYQGHNGPQFDTGKTVTHNTFGSLTFFELEFNVTYQKTGFLKRGLWGIISGIAGALFIGLALWAVFRANNANAASSVTTNGYFAQKAAFGPLNCMRVVTPEAVYFMASALTQDALVLKNVRTCLERAQRSRTKLVDKKEGQMTARIHASIGDLHCLQTDIYVIVFENRIHPKLDAILPICFDAAREGHDNVRMKREWFMHWI